MLNKMPCSADKLNLLEPTMIQSVVEASVFKLGSEYMAENRVRIHEADPASITSIVYDSSGLNKQIIHLKDGTLITQCSCVSTAQPLCRHCVAVLLAYHHRWGKPQPPEASPGKPMTEAPAEARQRATHAADLSLRDLMALVEWLQVAVSALERGHPLPESPNLGTTEVQGWIGSIQQLEARRREVEAELAVQMVLNTRADEISQLTQQLQASVQDLKAAQAASQAMQRELTQYRVMLGTLSDLAKEWDRVESQMRAIAGDLEKQRSQLESLSGSVKGASAALQDLAKLQHSTPPTS